MSRKLALLNRAFVEVKTLNIFICNVLLGFSLKSVDGLPLTANEVTGRKGSIYVKKGVSVFSPGSWEGQDVF